MTYKKWDLVLVPFPFTDLSSVKKRPALIISPKDYNKDGDLIISFVTSQTSVSYRVGDYKITEWKDAGLPKPSLIRMKFTTIHHSIVLKKIGTLSRVDVKGFSEVLLRFFS